MRWSCCSARTARALGLAKAAVLAAGAASAQDRVPPAAPAPPPARYQPAPRPYQPPPPRYGQPPPPGSGEPGYGQPPPAGSGESGVEQPPPPGEPSTGEPPAAHGRPGSGQQPAQPPYATTPQEPAPPVAVPVEPEPETHAPKYSLWTGARLSFVGFGFNFYENERGQPETTGNFLGNGLAPQIDLGARISHRYIPYVFWEHGFMGQGHRFDGTQARSSSDFYGVGLRYVSGDVDAVAFLTDLSIGRRVVTVSNGTNSYSMSGIEFFRLGLGVEIRVATLFALTPLFSISSGALNDSDGDIAFNCSPDCTDGVNGPTYKNGQVIRSARAYVVLSLGLGIHFDVFGK